MIRLVTLLSLTLILLPAFAKDTLLIIGGHEGVPENQWVFQRISQQFSSTFAQRGWEVDSIYGEASNQKFEAANSHTQYNLSLLQQKIQTLAAEKKTGDQVLLHFAGHGTVVNGKYRLQVAENEYLEADQITQMIEMLTSKGIKVGVTFDSCSSGQFIENYQRNLSSVTQKACIVTPTNHEYYRSNTSIFRSLLNSLPEKRASIFAQFQTARQQIRSANPFDNIFPQISSYPDGIRFSTINSALATSTESCTQPQLNKRTQVKTIADTTVSALLKQLEALKKLVEKTCPKRQTTESTEPFYELSYSETCMAPFERAPFQTVRNNSINVSYSSESQGLFQLNNSGKPSGCQNYFFSSSLRGFAQYEDNKKSCSFSPLDLCLAKNDAALIQQNPSLASYLESRIKADKTLNGFMAQCETALQNNCCHYNFQNYQNLERELYHLMIQDNPLSSQDPCVDFMI